MRTSGFALLVICIVACATQDPGPPMPSFATEAGMACGRTCKDSCSSCKLACGKLMRGATTSKQRSQCVDDCDAKLSECYSTCE